MTSMKTLQGQLLSPNEDEEVMGNDTCFQQRLYVVLTSMKLCAGRLRVPLKHTMSTVVPSASNKDCLCGICRLFRQFVSWTKRSQSQQAGAVTKMSPEPFFRELLSAQHARQAEKKKQVASSKAGEDCWLMAEALVLVDLPSQSLAQYQQYRDTVTCFNTHRTKIVTVAKVQVIRTRNSSIVILLPPKKKTARTNDCRHRVNQRCTTMTKLVLCSEPHACAQTAVRQMMMLVR